MLLSAIVLMPLFAALAALLLPREDERLCRRYGLAVSLLVFVTSVFMLVQFEPATAGMQLEHQVAWIPSFGITYHVGVDGLSLFLVLLTTFLVPISLLAAEKSVDKKIKEFVMAILVLETGMLGAFVALDMFLFFVFWEVMLVPMYLLIGIWGGERREYAAIKFVLYTMVGSVLMLVAIIYLYLQHQLAGGQPSFDLTAFQQLVLEPRTQLWCFLAFGLAFAIKVPMFPLHTWLPDAHVQAPTAGSVILAGVLLKLGTYGFLRFAIPLFPSGAVFCGPYIGFLAVVGILYGSMVALAQNDIKRLVAYSSVAHLGFVMLGLGALTMAGVQGSVYQMLAHGLSSAALFLAVGVLYERRHTRDLKQFGGLFREMPVFGAVLMIIVLASVGLPGLSGFVGELLILMGTFKSSDLLLGQGKLWAALATGGMILGAWYTLRMYQKVMFGPLSNPNNRDIGDITTRERFVFAPIVVLIFVMGLYPAPVLSRMEASTEKWLGDFQTRYQMSARVAPGAAPQLMDNQAPSAEAEPGAIPAKTIIKRPGGEP